MVKAIRIPDREGRRRHRLEQRERTHHRRLLKLAIFSPSLSPHQQQHQLQGEGTLQSSARTQETATTKSTATATPKSRSAVIRRKRMPMKRSRSPLSSSSRYSPSPSSSPYYSPLSLSCSSSSPPSISLSPLQVFAQSVAGSSPFSNPSSPELSSRPPLPPHPSSNLLRRTVSDPVQLLPHSTSLTPQKSALRSVTRDLMGQLPPLPPSASPPSQQQQRQQHLLRRTISDPVPMASPDFQEKQKGKMKEQEVEAEKLSGEWFVVKFNCECGEDNHYLVNASDKKYFKLLQ